MNDLPNLAQFDEQLRRVGRDDEQVGMGLNQDAGLALVGFAQAVASFNRFGNQGFEVGGIVDAEAVGTLAAEVGKAVRFRWIEAVHRLGEHEGERVFARASWSSNDQRVGKAPGADRLAQMGDGLRVAEEVLEAHRLSVEQWAAVSRRTNS